MTMSDEQRARDNARSKAYYHAHKEQRRAWARKYAAEHRAERAAKMATWYPEYSRRPEVVERRRAYNKAHRTDKAHHYWGKTLMRSYGITPFGFMRRLEQQRYSCARCHKPFGGTTPNIDHDHDTGEVRGLLCSDCNKRVHSRAELELTLDYLLPQYRRPN